LFFGSFHFDPQNPGHPSDDPGEYQYMVGEKFFYRIILYFILKMLSLAGGDISADLR